MDTSGRILIVEPNEADLRAITALMQHAGYESTPAKDGLEATKALKANDYDLIINEIQIPGFEEQELFQVLDRYAPNLPVIIHTAHPSLQSAIASIHLPVASYLVKPVQPEVLLNQVRTSLANYQAYKRNESLLKQTIVFNWAIEETIQVLESTRSSFKSKKLAALRRRLEHIIDGEHDEIQEK